MNYKHGFEDALNVIMSNKEKHILNDTQAMAIKHKKIKIKKVVFRERSSSGDSD